MAEKKIDEGDLILMIENASNPTGDYFNEARTDLIGLGAEELIKMGHPALAEQVREWSKTPELYKDKPNNSPADRFRRFLNRS